MLSGIVAEVAEVTLTLFLLVLYPFIMCFWILPNANLLLAPTTFHEVLLLLNLLELFPHQIQPLIALKILLSDPSRFIKSLKVVCELGLVTH